MNDFTYQRFKQGDETESKLINAFLKVLQPTMDDVKAYFEGLYSSPELGRVLYDKKLVPIYKILERQLFIQSFANILHAQQTIGSPNAYSEILYSIFGTNASITISRENPLHIMIDIVARYVEYFVWVDENYQFYVTTEQGDYLGFAALVARITNRQLADILKQMTNAGTYLEFTYKQENPNDDGEVYVENFETVGKPEIAANKWASNFTENDYLISPALEKLTSDDDFEINCEFIGGDDNGEYMLSLYEEATMCWLYFFNMNDGSGAEIMLDNAPPMVGIFERTNLLNLKYSKDTKTFTLTCRAETGGQIITEESEPAEGYFEITPVVYIGKCPEHDRGFTGEVNLKNLYVKKNDQIIYEPYKLEKI